MPVQQLTAHLDDLTLSGSLWEPEAAPRALLMMHPGSGPSDRDNDVLFPPIRAALLAADIAVCSFDKRGVGGSGGSWLTADIATQATDLVAGLVQARRRLPGVPVGLFGHSQGGWVVLEAALLADVRFVVTNSGPAVTPRVQEEFSTRNRLDRMPLPPATKAAADALFGEIMDRVGRGEPYPQVAQWLADPAHDDARAALAEAGAFVPDDQGLWDFAGTILDHDPLPALRALRVPLLALFGGQDSVVPVSTSIEHLTAAVRDPLLTVRVLSGGDHRIQTADDEFVPGYLDELVGFVAAVLD